MLLSVTGVFFFFLNICNFMVGQADENVLLSKTRLID